LLFLFSGIDRSQFGRHCSSTGEKIGGNANTGAQVPISWKIRKSHAYTFIASIALPFRCRDSHNFHFLVRAQQPAKLLFIFSQKKQQHNCEVRL